VGKYRDGGCHKTKLLGKIREITKSQAKEKFTEFLKPAKSLEISPNITLKSFIEDIYLPFYRRKWKESTRMTNWDRIQREIVSDLGDRKLCGMNIDELQNFLDSKSSLSHSVVTHLRWDLRQIFELAISKGIVGNDPTLPLYTPRGCSSRELRTMTAAEVKCAISVLELRERLIFKLAVFAGLRPGEIFGLRRKQLSENSAKIRERIYRGKLDSPKSKKSKREVAFSAGVREDLKDWLAVSPTGPEDWLFPSETLETPLSKDNALRRYILPRLGKVGLDWVNFQVMRRTYSSLMHKLGIDPKVVADLMGHDVDVNLNVYTQTSLETRLQAVETLESAFVN
jgi:integrase